MAFPMIPINQKSGTYQSVRGDQNHNRESHECTIRSDDTGLWNTLKSWYTFVLHLSACGLLAYGIIRIDDLDFKIGSGSTLLHFESTLYQAQITALISLGLVIIRIVAGSCSALLAWRCIFVLLEKRGMTLAEISCK